MNILDLNTSILKGLYVVNVKMGNLARRILTKYGLTYGEYLCLSFLNYNSNCLSKTIVEKTSLTFSAITQALQNLEKQNLVLSQPSESDSRSKILQISELGRQLFLKVEQDLATKSDQHIFYSLDKNQIHTLQKILLKILEN